MQRTEDQEEFQHKQVRAAYILMESSLDQSKISNLQYESALI